MLKLDVVVVSFEDMSVLYTVLSFSLNSSEGLSYNENMLFFVLESVGPIKGDTLVDAFYGFMSGDLL